MILLRHNSRLRTSTGRSCKRLLCRPAFLEAAVQSPVGYPKLCGPIWKVLRCAIECYRANMVAIARLLSWCCPPAIVRFVVAVLVGVTVNAMHRRWAWPHVGIKRCEGSPAITDSDSSPAVFGKVLALWVAATTIHTLPVHILRGSCHAMFTFAAWLTSIAVARGESRTTNDLVCSALANAVPVDVSAWSIRFSNDRPPTASLASQVYEVVSASSRISFSHDDTPDIRLVRTARRSYPSGCLHYSTCDMGGLSHAA